MYLPYWVFEQRGLLQDCGILCVHLLMVMYMHLVETSLGSWELALTKLRYTLAIPLKHNNVIVIHQCIMAINVIIAVTLSCIMHVMPLVCCIESFGDINFNFEFLTDYTKAPGLSELGKCQR